MPQATGHIWQISRETGRGIKFLILGRNIFQESTTNFLLENKIRRVSKTLSDGLIF